MRPEFIVNLLLAAIIGYLVYLVMLPFWVPVFWAVVLTILFYPAFTYLTERLGVRRSLASLFLCILIAVFILVPLWFVGSALINELQGLYGWAEVHIRKAALGDRTVAALLEKLHNLLARYVNISAEGVEKVVVNIIREVGSFATQGLRLAIGDLARLVLNFFFTFFAMYYLFKDGDVLLERISELLPIEKEAKEKIFRKNRDVISSTLYGGVLISALQGLIGGITFWVLGLSSPVMWGFFMLILAFLPVVGPSVVWGPAAIYLFVQGSYIKGAVLVTVGILLAIVLDNLLRPLIVSGKTKMNPVVLLFSILGAMRVFGFIGIIAGPIIVSIATAMVEIYRERMQAL